MGKDKLKRVMMLTMITVMLLVAIMITRVASEQNGYQSNTSSEKVVVYVMNTLMKNDIPINKEDVFWRITANQLIRKAAHFLEYLFIGVFLATLLNLLTRKLWISFPTALIICFSLAFLDEYRQQFVIGRGAAWADVRIDTYGSALGIVLVSLFFVVFNKFKQLKRELRELSDKHTNQ